MIAIPCQVEVEIRSVRIQFFRARTGKGEATKVETISNCVIIRVRILLEYGHYGWVCPRPQGARANRRAVRVHTGKLLGETGSPPASGCRNRCCPGTTG